MNGIYKLMYDYHNFMYQLEHNWLKAMIEKHYEKKTHYANRWAEHNGFYVSEKEGA